MEGSIFSSYGICKSRKHRDGYMRKHLIGNLISGRVRTCKYFGLFLVNLYITKSKSLVTYVHLKLVTFSLNVKCCFLVAIRVIIIQCPLTQMSFTET